MNLHDIVKKGSADRSVVVTIIDSTDGTPETGVVYNTAGIDLWYRREGAAVSSITEATLATLATAHADGGFLTISHGEYRLDLPDAAFATGANYVDFGGTVTGMVVIGGRVRLVDYDLEDSVRLGLTALPNAAADAAGGLPISDAGGLDLDGMNTTVSSRMAEASINTTGGAVDNVTTVTNQHTLASINAEVDTALVDMFTSSAQLVDDVWDETITAGQHNTAKTAGRLQRLAADIVLIDSAVDTTGYGASTTIEFGTDLTQVDNFFNDSVIVFTSGALTGQARTILSFTNVNGVMLLDEALTSAPNNNVTFSIHSTHVHPVTQIQAGLATETKQDAQDLIITDARLAELDAANLPADIADVPTVAEFETRTPTAAQLAYIVSNSADGLPCTFTGGTTTTAILGNVDGSTASATNDVYNGRILIFNAGTLNQQATDITDYDGATKTATITAVTTAVTGSHTANMK